MKRLTLICLILLVAISFSAAQNGNGSSQVSGSVNQLDFMVGEWMGTGWMVTRTGKEESLVREKAEYKLDKSIIVVEGLGTKFDSTIMGAKVVHNAFAVIFFNKETGALNINAYKDGESTTSTIEFIEEKVLRWNVEAPNRGKVRFTVDFRTKDKWIEIAEFSRDGENWMEFLGVELLRIDR